MEIVEMVLSGKLNKSITSLLNIQGIKAVGISGKDSSMLKVNKLMPNGDDIGLVGEVKEVDVSLINALIENDFVPVISPIGCDLFGNSYNVNADYAAVSIAGALKAEKLVFLTDVEGVRRDIDDSESVMSRLKVSEVNELITNGVITGGMIPKVECCIAGVNAGVKNVHILDGRVEHSLILEIFTTKGIGTLIEN
jgi:acetylglutamate kinase